jgi:hypothetical protein
MEGLDALAQGGVLLGTLRGLAPGPRVVATLGHLQDTAQRRHQVLGLVRSHESVRRLDAPAAS